MKTFTACFLFLFAVTLTVEGGTGKKKGAYEQPLLDEPLEFATTALPVPSPFTGGGTFHSPSGGIYTTLTGFYDYQSNGGACQYIRIDPATGALHVVYMAAPDSADPTHALRNVYYAYSTDGGMTWDNFNDVQIPGPPFRSGFPSLDIGNGILASSPVVANHNSVSPDPLFSKLYVDSPPGGGIFVELGSPPPLGGNEPIWPLIASTADGSIVMSASPNVTSGQTNQYTVLEADLVTWMPWTIFPGVTLVSAGGGRHPAAGNGTGRAALLLNNSNGSSGVYMLESTDNGITWPSSPDTLYDLLRIAGSDTSASYVHCDIVYNGEEPLVVMDEYDARVGTPPRPEILFWSPSAGYVSAVKFDSTLYIEEINLPGGIVQRFHAFSVGWPVIGLSGSTIGVAYQVFQAETSVVSGFNYSDIWFVKSEDGGLSWSEPINLTGTQFLDERYPSISKWNPPGEFNIVWQEDTEPGSHAFADLAPVTRSSQVFMKYLFTGVDDDEPIPQRFSLRQNYPNPFNPTTRISFTIPERAHVKLTVHNLLGQVVSVLVDGVREGGTYEVDFAGKNLPSGVYYYTLRAGGFASTRKMMSLR
jgi:hypothetical protein